MAQADKLEEYKKVTKSIKRALLTLFGYIDTDTSFYLLPPTLDSAVNLMVLGDSDQARALVGRLAGMEEISYVQWSDSVVVVRREEYAAAMEVVRRGVRAEALTLLDERQFDPRGGNLDNWSDTELRSYLDSIGIKSVTGLIRDDMITMIRDDYFGIAGAGTTTEDPTTGVSERLVRIYDALASAESIRGQKMVARKLVSELGAHRETGFETGRKRRISEMKRLIKLVTLDEDMSEGIMSALTEMGRI